MKGLPVNKTEEFVLSVCRRSFLSLWCYNNPKGKDGDELCDILVVCDPDLVIISVKEVVLKVNEYSAVEHTRWKRKAVDDSVKQIYGAQRWLASASNVIRSDGTCGVFLPTVAERNVHRVAVAFGGQGEVPIPSGDFGKGYVHVMSECSFHEVLTELDTVTDLVKYLAAKENSRCSKFTLGSESNLLGWYLFNGRTFPSGLDAILVDDGIWEDIQEKPQFKRRKEADRESYFWDRLIECLSDPDTKPVIEAGPQLTNLEFALRSMAREDRLSRRILGRGVREFVEQAKAGRLRSRIMLSPSGVIYVFAFFKPEEETKLRAAELANRCFLARHVAGCGDTVIGVGISEYIQGIGSASDLIYLNLGKWSAADDKKALRMKADCGCFADAAIRRLNISEDEYPESG